MISRLLLALALAIAFTTAQQAGAQQTTWQPLGGRSGVPPYSFYTQPHAYLGQPAQPICQLTAAATVNSDAQTCLTNPKAGIGNQSVTLTGASTLALPGHLPAKGGVSILYQITHSGADGPILANGFQYPGGTQPPACNGTTIVSGCWSTTAGITDWLPCVSINSGGIACGTVITGMASITKAFVQGKIGAYVAGPTTTGSVTLNSAASAGQTILCMVVADGGTAPTSVNDGGSNNLALLNSSTVGAGHFVGSYNKVGLVGAPITITATWAAATGHQLGCDVYSGVTATDGSNINSQLNGTGGTDVWVSGNITPTVTGDIIWGVNTTSCGVNATPGTGFTTRSTDSAPATSYAINTEDKTVSTTSAVQATFSGLTTGGCTAGNTSTATAVVGLR